MKGAYREIRESARISARLKRNSDAGRKKASGYRWHRAKMMVAPAGIKPGASVEIIECPVCRLRVGYHGYIRYDPLESGGWEKHPHQPETVVFEAFNSAGKKMALTADDFRSY